MRCKLALYLLVSFFVASPLRADPPYPRFRYIAVPMFDFEELAEIPGWATGSALEDLKQKLNRNSVALHFEVERGPGNTQRFLIGNYSYAEYERFLKAPAPALDGAEIAELRADIDYVRFAPDRSSAESIRRLQKLGQLLGPVRMQFMLHGINFYPAEVLYAIAALDAPPADKPFLSLRRFGVMRRRSTYIEGDDSIENMLRRKKANPLDPLKADLVSHLVVGDISTAFIPGVLPPPVQSFSESTSYDDFSEKHPSFLTLWSIGSEEVHDLSYRAYKAQILRGHRPSIDEQLLSTLKATARTLDLSRMFFVLIEDYIHEKALEVMAFIDGGHPVIDYYELPIEKRFSAIEFRKLYPGEIIEVHGLAIDPEASELKGILSTDAMALQLYDFIESGAHEKTTFLLQADALPARLYRSFGFQEIEGSRQMLEKELIAMAATGEQLKTRIAEIFPSVRRVMTPEMPNRINRRNSNPQIDFSCINQLRNFGHL